MGTFGDLATAAFIVAAASGVAVAIPYQPGDAYGSIATMLLVNPAAAFFRNLHYWSGQACLLATRASRLGPSPRAHGRPGRRAASGCG